MKKLNPADRYVEILHRELKKQKYQPPMGYSRLQLTGMIE